MAKPMTCLDGADSNGVRAEVIVMTGTGRVFEIVTGKGKGTTANVKIKVESLRHPYAGWVPMDDPLYAAAVEAQASGKDVNFRVESQRKPGVDRTIPIAELRVNMETANEKTLLVLAGLDGILSREAVTNPAEDDLAGASGRYSAVAQAGKAPAPAQPQDAPQVAVPTLSATDAVAAVRASVDNGVSTRITDILAAAAISAGASVEDVTEAVIGGSRAAVAPARPNHRATGFAREEPSWKPLNSDGRINFGSSLMAAAVGAEHFVRDYLTKNDILSTLADSADGNALVERLVITVLNIADDVQVAMYGEGFTADRSTGSHIRTRGIVYNTVENYLPLTVVFSASELDEDAFAAWTDAVRDMSIERFTLASKVAYAEEYAREELIAQREAQREAAMSAAPAAPAQNGDAPADPWASPATEGFFRPTEIDVDAPTATPETVSVLRELFADSGVENVNDLSKLLRLTFGEHRAAHLPDEALAAFLDFYVLEPEVFVSAVAWAAEQQ